MICSCSYRELKDNLGSDEPEGDAPLLLQTMLARNPGIFREKSTDTHTATTSIIKRSQQGFYRQAYGINKRNKHNSPFPNRCYAATDGTTVQNHPEFHAQSCSINKLPAFNFFKSIKVGLLVRIFKYIIITFFLHYSSCTTTLSYYIRIFCFQSVCGTAKWVH